MTLAEIREAVLRHLGDRERIVWSAAEVDTVLRDGYRELAGQLHVFPDWTYLENLPAGFNYTAAWELMAVEVPFQYALANYTLADEKTLLDDTHRIGPGNHTCPIEATDGWLDDADADTGIPATAELPRGVTELERVLWDERTIDALSLRQVQLRDTRYQLTEGEVYGYLWQQDGVRTLRKIRKPAAQAATVTVTGSWGALRTPDEVTA